MNTYRKIEKVLEDWFRREGLQAYDGLAWESNDGIQIDISRLARVLEEELFR